jgi:hypothetical protein
MTQAGLSYTNVWGLLGERAHATKPTLINIDGSVLFDAVFIYLLMTHTGLSTGAAT